MEEAFIITSYSITTAIWGINGALSAFLFAGVLVSRKMRSIIEKD